MSNLTKLDDARVSQPYELSDAQLDHVSGGLVNVFLIDVVDINNNDVNVAVPVNAAVAANILTVGSIAAAEANQYGRQDA